MMKLTTRSYGGKTDLGAIALNVAPVPTERSLLLSTVGIITNLINYIKQL